jgi:DNA-binding NarL/FixJ family response regulator
MTRYHRFRGERATPAPNRPTIVFADDHVLVASGIATLLEDEFRLLGTASDGRTAVELTQRFHPDVALLDISMPLMNGLDAARMIRATVPSTKIVILTMHSDRAFVAEAIRAGASGYVLKRSVAHELSDAIRDVLRNRVYITPLIADFAPEDLEPSAGGADTQITERQREVLQLVAEGRSSRQAAAILGVSAKTIEFHKARIKQRLGIRTTAELTRYAMRNGMVGPIG